MKLQGKLYRNVGLVTVAVWLLAWGAFGLFVMLFPISSMEKYADLPYRFGIVSVVGAVVVYGLLLLYMKGYLKALSEGNDYTREYNRKHAQTLASQLSTCSVKLKNAMKQVETNAYPAYKSMMATVEETNMDVEIYLSRARAHQMYKPGFHWRKKTVYKVDDKHKKVWCDMYVASDKDIRKVYEYVAQGYELVSEKDGPYRTLPMARVAFPAKRED